MGLHIKLHSLIKHNKYDKIASLIERGLDVNMKYINDGNTPLRTAIEVGNKRIVELLLKNGADPEVTTPDYLLPIHIATKFGHLEIVKLLVKYGARIDSRTSLDRKCPIHVAAYEGHIHIIKYFLDLGVNINLTSRQGTALHWAANSYDRLSLHENAESYEYVLQGHVASYHHVIRYLVEKGANIDHRNIDGQTALHICARRCFVKGIKFLVEKGASVEVLNNSYRTPVEEFFRSYTNLQSAQILIKYMLLQSKKPCDHHNIRNFISDPNYPDTHPYTRALTNFLNNCKTEIDKMKTCTAGNTTMSMYTFLQDMFDADKSVAYLSNENIRKELKNIEDCLNEFPIYSSVNVTINYKVEDYKKRLDLVQEACEIMDDTITPILPSEIKQMIFSYLSILNLNNFVNAIDKRDIDDKGRLNPVEIEDKKKATKAYTTKSKLSIFFNAFFGKSS